MCGITAIAGQEDVAKSLLASLLKLEYRGYDSCGMMLFDGKKATVKKNVGDIHSVNNQENFLELKGNIGLAHTRWATHGGVTKTNSHPHISNDGNFVIAHNGIISNYLELKQQLIEKGYSFFSETDTEIFVNLFQENFKVCADSEKSFVKSLKMISGHYAVVAFSKYAPNQIFAAREDSPLVIGIADDSIIVASDINAVVEKTKNLVNFMDGEYCVFDAGKVQIKSIADGKIIKRETKRTEWDSAQGEKGEFSHFMIKEIFDQPVTIRNVLKISSACMESVAENFPKAKKSFFVGVGTTYYVAMAGSYLFSKYAKEYVPPISSDEFENLVIPDTQTHCVFFSQSGETYDTRRAVKCAKKGGAKTSAVVNVIGSSISQDVDHCIFQSSGPEISVVSTKAAVAQIVILYRLALLTGKFKGLITDEEIITAEENISDFCPLLSNELNEKSGLIRKIAKDTSQFHNWLFIGRSLYYPIAMEASLKMKEVTYLHTEGIPGGFLKHGTLAIVDDSLLNFFFLPGKKDTELYKQSLFGLEEIKARNGKTIGFADEDNTETRAFFDYVIPFPKIAPELLPIYQLIMAQLLSYYSALYLKRNIDKPRNLAKSVTVA